MQGVDFAFSRPAPAAIRAAGYGFVARYYSSAADKNLTRAEADGYLAVGLKIVTVWEDGGTDALLGVKAGLAAGAQAAAQGASCGQPPGTAIFAAVDFDAQPSQLTQVVGYLRAFNGACQPYQGGAYGGLAVVQAAREAGIAWLWQTEAWSGGHVLPGAHLLQHAQGATVAGAQVDVNTALADPFGAWPATVVPLPPPPAPTVAVPIDSPEEPMQRLIVQVPTDASGCGSAILDGGTGSQPGVTSRSPAVDSVKVIAVGGWGADPPVDGYQARHVALWQDRGGHPLITVAGAVPGHQAAVWVSVAD